MGAGMEIVEPVEAANKREAVGTLDKNFNF